HRQPGTGEILHAVQFNGGVELAVVAARPGGDLFLQQFQLAVGGVGVGPGLAVPAFVHGVPDGGDGAVDPAALGDRAPGLHAGDGLLGQDVFRKAVVGLEVVPRREDVVRRGPVPQVF